MLLRLNYMWVVVCVLRTSVAYLQANKSKAITKTNGCSCQYSGKMYNIEPLEEKGGSSRFTVRAEKYEGYMYAYNPCISFKIGPSSPSLNGKGCQKDVAVCWWFPQHLHSYTNIGTQSSVECGLDNHGNPQLEYTSFRQKSRKSIVQLRCDPSKKDAHDAFFEVLDEDNWVFRLTHNCACADACPVSAPTFSSNTATNAGVVVPTVIAAVGVILVVPIFLLFRRWRRRQQEAEERRRLIDVPRRVDQPNDINCQGDLPHPIPETTMGRNSSNSALPISLSFNDITVSPKDKYCNSNKNLLSKTV